MASAQLKDTMLRVISAVCLLTCLAIPTLAVAGTGCDGAGNCYVRAGAAGTGTGASWTNAYTGFGTGAGQMNPSSMTGGVTYWMGAGTYSAPTWTASGSSGSPITVEAATAAVHGPDATWSSGYAGQVVFSGVTTLTGSYWTINGQSSGATYPTNTAQNIKFWNASNGSQWAFGNGGTGSYTNWTLEYVEILGTNTAGASYTDEGFECGGGTTATCSNINLLYDWIHAAGTDLISSNSWNTSNPGTGWVIDHTWLDHNCADQDCGPSGTHAQGAQLTVSNLTISNSVWQDMMSSGFITDANGDTGTGPAKSKWLIYGNIFFWDATFAAGGVQTMGEGDGIIGDFNSAPTASVFENNTIYGIISTGSGSCSSSAWYAVPSDSITENNLWEDTTNCNPSNSSSAGTWNYNTYGKNSSDSSDTSSQKQSTSSELLSSPTASTLAGFALAANTSAGATISTLCSTDMLGVARGTNGTWDRGAEQLGSTTSASASPNPPAALTVTVK